MKSVPAVKSAYLDQGFCKVSGFLTAEQVSLYDSIVNTFHQSWLTNNANYYEKGVLNSAYLTTCEPPHRINTKQRQALFKLIASDQLVDLIKPIFKLGFRFMNTQLFFNPKNNKQNNYWHRDGQYHLSLDEQKQALIDSTVLHCRIALRDEPGIELVPRSHVQWDSEQELAVRLETDGHSKHHDLDSGHRVSMKSGDLLIFSANMLHRGLYGGDRLALDILYCDDQQSVLSHRRDDCLPPVEHWSDFDQPSVFEARKEKGSV